MSLSPDKWRTMRRSVRLHFYKPVSVPFQAAVIPLGRTLLRASSDLPGSLAERAAPPPLFGLAPRGVCHAARIAPAAVRFYRTISPLLDISAKRYIFCCTFRRTLRSARPLAGTLPSGDRTFLPRFRGRLPERTASSKSYRIFGYFCTLKYPIIFTNLLKVLQIPSLQGMLLSNCANGPSFGQIREYLGKRCSGRSSETPQHL